MPLAQVFYNPESVSKYLPQTLKSRRFFRGPGVFQMHNPALADEALALELRRSRRLARHLEKHGERVRRYIECIRHFLTLFSA